MTTPTQPRNGPGPNPPPHQPPAGPAPTLPTAHLEGKPWSPRRYYYTTLTFLGIQVGVIWLLEEPPRAARVPDPVRTRIQLATETWPHQAWQTRPLLHDAALIPLPNPQGFSGDAWLRFTSLPYAPTDWVNPELWLALDTHDLGDSLRDQTARHRLPPLRIADKAVPRLVVDELVVPNLQSPAQSLLVIEWDQTGKTLPQQPSLPAWPNADILTNTVVQIAIQPDGTVFSAALLHPCGLPEADAFALRLARTLQFNPEQPDNPENFSAAVRLTFGRLIFRWHTEPPAPAAQAGQQPS